MANFGERERLTVDRAPVGRLLPPGARADRAARRLMHRGGAHRRAGRPRPTASGWPAGPGWGSRAPVRRPPRQRRDLLRRRDRPAHTTRHHVNGNTVVGAARRTPSSPPSSRRPRRPSSTACSQAPTVTGRAGNTSPQGLPADRAARAASPSHAARSVRWPDAARGDLPRTAVRRARAARRTRPGTRLRVDARQGPARPARVPGRRARLLRRDLARLRGSGRSCATS